MEATWKGSIQEKRSILKNNEGKLSRSSRPYKRECSFYLSFALPILYVAPMVTILATTFTASFMIFMGNQCSTDSENEIGFEKLILSNVVSECFIFLGYPIAGWLADTKFGRFKVFSVSLWFLWGGLVMLTLGSVFYPGVCDDGFFYYTGRYILIPTSIVLLQGSAIMFFPNILAFIVDQLVDVSNSTLGSIVRWFAWSTSLGYLFTYTLFLATNFQPTIVIKNVPILALAMTAVCSITIIIHIYTKSVYMKLMPNPLTNPYKILYGVLKFTYKHKVPVNRSALTYWEEDAPKRIDVAKEKYGGPYTTENVEDVKTLGRIVFIIILPLFIYYVSLYSLNAEMIQFLQFLDKSDNPNDFHYNKWILYLLDPIITLISIPILELVILQLYPKFEYLIIKFFKWIGAGTLALLISTASFLLIDIFSYDKSIDDNCFLKTLEVNGSLSSWWILIPAFFWGVSDLLVSPSVYCFLCSQAPYHMRGMILGFFMLMQQLSYFVASQIGILFGLSKEKLPYGCGVWYWSIQVFLSLLAIFSLGMAACCYKRRERQEIEQHVRIIEDIYEKRLDMKSDYSVSDATSYVIESVQ